MISLQTSETIVTTVLLFFAYVVSITLSGNFQAYVAKWMGDDTADSLGLTEFNPFLFIDWLSLVWFVILQVMVGRPIPIEINNIQSSYWSVRVFFAFGAHTILNIFIATTASIIAFLLCGPISHLAGPLLGSSIQLTASLQHGTSSWSILLCMFCGSLIWVNLVLAMFSSVRQAIYFFVMYKLHRDYSFIIHADYLLMFGPLLIWYFFGNLIFKMFLYIVGCLVLGITKICGII